MRKDLPAYLAVACSLVLAVGYFFYYHDRMLTMPLRFNDDVVQHYLWLYDVNWADATHARASGDIQPWGYRALLRFVRLFAEPLPISRYGPLFTTLLTAGYATAVIRRFLPTVIALAGTYLLLQFAIPTGLGFLARSFCVPLLLAFAYYLLTDSRRGVAATFVVSGFFYPPALLVNGTIFLGWEAWAWLRSPARHAYPRERWPHWRTTVAAALVAGAVVLAHSWSVSHAPELGTMFSAQEMHALPEFDGDGRVGFNYLERTGTFDFTDYYLTATFDAWAVPYFPYVVLGLALLLGLLTWRRTGPFGRYLLLFWPVTLLLFVAAQTLTPLLFLADRYYQYPWMVAAPFTCTFIVGCLWKLYPRAWLAPLLALPLVILGHDQHRADQLSVIAMDDRVAIFDALAELPEDALIAAPPQLASFIPLISERAVLLSHESAHALYFRNYYGHITPRYRDYVTAMTTTSPDSLRAFMDRYAVTHLLVDPNLGSSLYGMFKPYKSDYQLRIANIGAEGAASVRMADSLGVRLNKEVLLLSRGAMDGFGE